MPWGLTLLNILARAFNYVVLGFPSVTIRLAGAGVCSALIKSCAARIEESVDDIFVMLYFLGKNSTVSEILSTLVCGIYSLWCL